MFQSLITFQSQVHPSSSGFHELQSSGRALDSRRFSATCQPRSHPQPPHLSGSGGPGVGSDPGPGCAPLRPHLPEQGTGGGDGREGPAGSSAGWVPAQTLTRGPTEAGGAGIDARGGGWRGLILSGDHPSCLPRPGQRRLSTQLRGGGLVPASSSVRAPSQQWAHPAVRTQEQGSRGTATELTLVGDTGPLLPRTLAVCGTGPGTGGSFC